MDLMRAEYRSPKCKIVEIDAQSIICQSQTERTREEDLF